MKLLAVFLAAGAWLSGLSVEAADLAAVKSVYLMPMSGGLDQYLAIRLTNGGAFQVVTDPQKADAIFTDRIGANFEQSLQDMYGEKKKSDGKLSSEDFTKPTSQPGSRGKGSLFVVERPSRIGIWSAYAKAKRTGSDDMNHLAPKIADQLSKDRAC